MDEEKKGEELSLRDILFIIKKHVIALILCIVVGGAGGIAFDMTQPVEYSASATLLANINRESGSVSSSDYTLANYLSDTFVQLIKEDRIANETLARINADHPEYKLTKQELTKGIESECTSLFVKVKFTYAGHEDDENFHQDVVNTLVEVVYEISQTPNVNDPSKGQYPLLFNNLAVFSTASRRVEVSHLFKRAAIGAAIGLVVAVIYIVLRELIDNRFKSAEELESYLGLPVLASIPVYTLEDFGDDSSNESSEEVK